MRAPGSGEDLLEAAAFFRLPQFRREQLSARRTFSRSALDLHGIYELQTLESVLRNENPDAIVIVARMVRAKANLPDDGDDYGFLSDYCAALCAHLESNLMVGRRHESKFAQ